MRPMLQTWSQYAQVKSAYFKASANHSTATVLHGKDQYGDEVDNSSLFPACA
jgi:hypothetical protein